MADHSRAIEAKALLPWPRWRAALTVPGSAILMVAFPVLAAVLTAYAFPPQNLGWIAWVGLVPFCLVIPNSSWTFERYLGAILASLAFYAIGLSFIDTFDQVLSSASPGRFRQLWLAATTLGIWVWPMTLLLSRRLHLRCGFPLTASFPIAWVVVEHARHWFCLLLVGNECPWLHLGYSQVEFGPVLQIAAIGGMDLVSFLICSVNAAIAVAILALHKQEWPGRCERAGLALTALSFLAAVSYGSHQLALEAQAPSAVFRVALVPRARMIAHAGSEAHMLDRDLEGRGFRPDLLLYGENTVESLPIPSTPSTSVEPRSDEGGWGAILRDVARKMGAHLVVGATRVSNSGGSDRRHVCAVLVSPEMGVVAWSDKSALVPFAESSPAWADHPWVRAFLPVTEKNDDFTPSGRMGTFATPAQDLLGEVRLGAAICYDVSSVGTFRAAAPQSDAFLVLGNEPVDPRRCTPSWLLNMTRCRAVETHRAIARTSIGGTTCVINPDGGIMAASFPKLGTFEDSILLATLPLSNIGTPYGLMGDWLVPLCWSSVAIGLLWSHRTRK